MRFLIIILLFIIFFLPFNLSGQQKAYWVVFKDKSGSQLDALSYFNQKAIFRRFKNNQTLYDQTDFPLCKKYTEEIDALVNDTLGQSRWFNALAVMAELWQIEKILKLEFVKEVVAIAQQANVCELFINDELNTEDLNLLKMQTERMQGQQFKQHGITGKGIRIAVLDGGFPKVDVHEAFEKIRNENRIVKTWDFVKKREFVFDYSSHGTSVLSNIGGICQGLEIGLASQSEFLLARTEVNTEPYREEVYWMQAMEWADKNGADIISSSLGYTYHRYFPEEMDGKQSLVSKAATMAARKGMLVITAMGNDGSNSWKTLGAPADADSVLSIGGINPDTDIHINFSSFGPTADKRRKPNVVAFGKAFVANTKGYKIAHGTSFATPLVAGFAACAWETKPQFNAMQILVEIEKSGHLYPYFDYAHGYGVPQANHFLIEKDTLLIYPTFSFMAAQEHLQIVLNDSVPSSRFVNCSNLLYYHIENGNGFITKYEVIKVYTNIPLVVPFNDIKQGQRVVVCFNGYSDSYQF